MIKGSLIVDKKPDLEQQQTGKNCIFTTWLMLITSRLLQMQKLFRKSSQLISNFIKLHKSQETQASNNK